jgi:hypothetical protein
LQVHAGGNLFDALQGNALPLFDREWMISRLKLDKGSNSAIS